MALFTGPLPPPETLAKYNDAFLGCPERIVAMAEEQASHRRAMEAKVIDSKIARERTSQWLGFIAFVGVCALSAYLFTIGKDNAAIGLLVTNLLAFVSAYIYGQKKQERELGQKQKPFEPQSDKQLPSKQE